MRSAASGSARPSSSTANAPERFDLTYIGEDNARHRPVVIHRAIFGSFERFIAHARSSTTRALSRCGWRRCRRARSWSRRSRRRSRAKCRRSCKARGIRVDLDVSNDKLGAKIRRAQLEKIPYMLVVGDKEVAAGTVAPRLRDGKQLEPMASMRCAIACSERSQASAITIWQCSKRNERRSTISKPFESRPSSRISTA